MIHTGSLHVGLKDVFKCAANSGAYCIVMFLFTAHGLAALVVSSPSSGQWHEMIDVNMSQV